MNFATGRHMCKDPFRHAYEVEDIVGMVRAVYGKRVVFHDGDEEIQPGISVHLIGGHTAGIQSVRIMTRNGWLVLASDASHYFWGINNDKLFAIVYSVADMLAGYDKLKKLADGRVEMVIPGHDAEVMTRFPASKKSRVARSNLRAEARRSGEALPDGGKPLRPRISLWVTLRLLLLDVPQRQRRRLQQAVDVGADGRRRGELPQRHVRGIFQHAQLHGLGDLLLLGRIGLARESIAQLFQFDVARPAERGLVARGIEEGRRHRVQHVGGAP